MEAGNRRGWFRLPNDLLDASGARIGPYGIAVYAALARHANKDGECWPSHRRIGEVTGIGRQKIIATIQTLEAGGLVEKRGVRDGTGTTVYVLPLVADPDTPLSTTTTPPVVNTDKGCPPQRHPPVRHNDTPCPPRGHKQDTENKTHLNKTHQGAGGAFEEFWNVYPKQEKERWARAAWIKLNPSAELVRIIVADVARRMSSRQWQKQDGQFIQSPETYLENRLWENSAPKRQAKETDDEYRNRLDKYNTSTQRPGGGEGSARRNSA